MPGGGFIEGRGGLRGVQEGLEEEFSSTTAAPARRAGGGLPHGREAVRRGWALAWPGWSWAGPVGKGKSFF